MEGRLSMREWYDEGRFFVEQVDAIQGLSAFDYLIA